MKQAKFNNLINLEYPDGFVELSDLENQRYFMGNLMRLSFINKEKHILISLSKSKDSIFNKFISIPMVASSSLANLENNLKEYQYLEEKESMILDNPSLTESFSYHANDEDVYQYGELTVFKFKKAIYSIYSICRLEDKEECKKLFDDFKQSFKLNKQQDE